MSFAPATEADIATVMEIERTPGYEAFIGTFTEDEHRAHMASPDARYFVWREAGAVAGFVIFLKLTNPNRVIEAKRIAFARTGTGLSRRFMPAMIDWAFETGGAHRLELDCSMENSRAQHVYEREGFVREGVVRDVYLSPDGTYVSSALFSILRPEWEAMRGRA